MASWVCGPWCFYLVPKILEIQYGYNSHFVLNCHVFTVRWLQFDKYSTLHYLISKCDNVKFSESKLQSRLLTLGCANQDLWALGAPIFIIVVYCRTATSYFLGVRNNWYQSYNSTIIEIGAQKSQSGPIAWPSSHYLTISQKGFHIKSNH